MPSLPSQSLIPHSPPSPGLPPSQTEAEAAIQRMLDRGQTFLAHDLAREALRRFPDSARLRQATALALLRAGALAEAQQVLEDLYPAPMRADVIPLRHGAEADEETLGLIARVYKDLWKRSGRVEDARRARDAYGRGFEASGGSWTGINAATLSWIVGDRARASQLAGSVLEATAQAAPHTEADHYWHWATCGEALLLLGREEEAVAAYTCAASLAGRRYGAVAASRQQLQLLASHGFSVPSRLFQAMTPPAVVVFVGHMLDRPGRAAPRFPSSQEDAVRDRIAEHLDETDARIGYCSAACGSDLLFIEAMYARDAEVHVVLPYSATDFLDASVRYAGPHWVTRFEEALTRAASVKYLSEESVQGDDSLFAWMGRMLLGYATLAAQPLGADPILLAVWDGRASALAGGTADLVAGWPDPSRRRIIPLGLAPRTGVPPAPHSPQPRATPTQAAIRRQVKTLLFADVVGYSQIQEDRMPAFMFSFLERVAQNLPPTDGFVNTWGDAIFVLMDDATRLAEYALALQEVVCDTDWAEYGLPREMSIRIGLHAGPVFEGIDPITGTLNYYGSHVNRAARIEPVTVPGNIYASEQFAALLTAEQQAAAHDARRSGQEWQPAFACEYIGTLDLARDFGSLPTYHLRRGTPASARRE